MVGVDDGFVGGLPYHTSDATLHSYFEQLGELDEAVVITDRQTSKSRGYGFVTMKDRQGAERACKDPNPILDGRKANVNLAYLGAKPRGNVQLASECLLATPAAILLSIRLSPCRPTIPRSRTRTRPHQSGTPATGHQYRRARCSSTRHGVRVSAHVPIDQPISPR